MLIRFFIFMISLITPLYAFSYIGPGVGLSALGSILAFIAIILLLIIGFIWYPLKKIIKKNRTFDHDPIDENSDKSSGF
ncbi:hypothetical protein KKB55_05875 [Myxococcota bacterium]|nr:hypothetical protein [Myxococcota bacterium]MBU1897279.1 hypothetical protein [Myxococcota bacterium]